MAHILDRFQRLSDRKEFAVMATGGPTRDTADRVVLEAEDGERVESCGGDLRAQNEFVALED